MSTDLILIAVVIALQPIPLVAHLMTLSSKGGIRNGVAFLVGWTATLAGVMALTLAITDGNPVRSHSTPSTAALTLKLAIGFGLLYWAWRTHVRPARPSTPPTWMARVDSMHFPAAMALGFLVQPWPLVAAGAATGRLALTFRAPRPGAGSSAFAS